MTEEKRKVEPLKKIFIDISAGTSAEIMNLTPRPKKADFIFGLGPQGLTPLEHLLAGKAVGEAIALQVRKEEIHPTFAHLAPAIMPAVTDKEPIYLDIVITDVQTVESREVIREMARIADCGDNCCGCH